MSDMYPWLKAMHIIAVIAWMAALLYLPRLFVYHCGAEPGSAASQTFKVMERRLLHAIMTPAMVASWVLGLALLWLLGPGVLQEGWLLAKLGLVTVLTVVHGVLARHLKAFAQDRNTWPELYFRILNEVPTVLMIAIVVLVIVRPF